MKRLALGLFLMLLVTSAYAQWGSLNGGLTGGLFYSGAQDAIVYDGEFVVTGSFSMAGSTTAGGIAAWDGSSWRALGNGTGFGQFGAGATLLEYDGGLLVSGSFDSVDGVAATNLAFWDGSSWTAFPGAPNESCVDMVTDGTNIYAVGEFDEIGGETVQWVAQYDGSAWSGIGGIGNEGPNGSVDAVEYYDGHVYIGGTFNVPGQDIYGGFARLENNEWVGQGINQQSSHINDMAVHDGLLYCAGSSILSGGDLLAAYDGTDWTAIDLTTDAGDVYGLTIVDGVFYLCGTFTTVNGLEANGFCSWDGTEVTVYDGGMTSDTFVLVFDAEIYNDALYAAGAFTHAGGEQVDNVAVWGGTAVGETTPTQPTGLRLISAYPNPFNPSTTLAMELDRPGMVSLTVTNLLGQEVARLLDQRMAAGSHRVAFNGAALPSGVYLAHLTTEHGVQASTRLVLMK